MPRPGGEGSVLGPSLLHVLSTAALPQSLDLTTATFADDTKLSHCSQFMEIQFQFYYILDTKKQQNYLDIHTKNGWGNGE